MSTTRTSAQVEPPTSAREAFDTPRTARRYCWVDVHVSSTCRFLAALPADHHQRGRNSRFRNPGQGVCRVEVGPRGALYVGSPEAVAQEIAAHLTALGANRFDLKYGMGGLEDESLMTNIELYATRVIPRAGELPAQRPGAHA